MCAGSNDNWNSMVQAMETMATWEWDASPQNKASGSVSQLWRTQLKTSYQRASAIVWNSAQLAGVKSRHWVSWSGRIANPQPRSEDVQGSHDRRACGGKQCQVADVKRPSFHSKMIAAGWSDWRMLSFFSGKLEMFVIDLWVRKDATSRRPGSPRNNERQTIRPVRSKGLAREGNVAEFDLGGVEDAQEEMQSRITCRGRARHGSRDKWSRARRTCQAIAEASHTIESWVGSVTWCPTCRPGIGAVFNVDISGIEDMMINIHLCALIMVIWADMPHRCWSRRIDQQVLTQLKNVEFNELTLTYSRTSLHSTWFDSIWPDLTWFDVMWTWTWLDSIQRAVRYRDVT